MKGLFYTIVEYITECVTGIENGAIKLWELERYLEWYNLTAAVVNIVIGGIVFILAVDIIEAVVNLYLYRKLKKQGKLTSE